MNLSSPLLSSFLMRTNFLNKRVALSQAKKLQHLNDINPLQPNVFEVKFSNPMPASYVLEQCHQLQFVVPDIEFSSHPSVPFQPLSIATHFGDASMSDNFVFLKNHDSSGVQKGYISFQRKQYEETFKILKNGLLLRYHSMKREGDGSPCLLPDHSKSMNSIDRLVEKKNLTPEEMNELILSLGRQGFRNQMNWYSNEVDIHGRLGDTELKYISACIDEIPSMLPHSYFALFFPSESYVDVPEFGFSFSVKGDKINPYRFIAGSTKPSKKIMMLAQQVAMERGIPLIVDPFSHPLKPNFCGFGWDLGKNIIKVYYTINTRDIPSEILSKANSSPYIQLLCEKNEIHPEMPSSKLFREKSLFSLSFWLNGKGVQEEKYYVYPRAYHKDIKFDGSIMIASQRGILHQHDCFYSFEELEKQKYIQSKEWHSKLNKTGNEILDKLESVHSLLWAIEYVNSDEYSLYFPWVF